jgi:hypothetical protein
MALPKASAWIRLCLGWTTVIPYLTHCYFLRWKFYKRLLVFFVAHERTIRGSLTELLGCPQSSSHGLKFQKRILHDLSPATAVPRSPETKIKHLAHRIAGVGTYVVPEHVVGQQYVASTPGHLPWLSEINRRVRNAGDEGIGPMLTQMFGRS